MRRQLCAFVASAKLVVGLAPGLYRRKKERRARKRLSPLGSQRDRWRENSRTKQAALKQAIHVSKAPA